MVWAVELAESAADALDALDPPSRRRIQRFFQEWLQQTDNPRQRGKPLAGRYAGLWRYRVGDYRLVCQIQDARLVVLVVKLGHRGDVYKKPP